MNTSPGNTSAFMPENNGPIFSSTPAGDTANAPKPPGETPVPAIRIFGVGTAGINILATLGGEMVNPESLIAVHSDAKSLAACPVALKVHLESRLLRDLGTGGDPDRGRAAAEEHVVRIKQICETASTVILVAGLGGGAGTGITPVIARVAKDTGAFVLTIAIMPFDCEGNLRDRVARGGLEELLNTSDLVITHHNQKLFSLISESTSLVETFKSSNELLSRSVVVAYQALTAQPVMGIPFSDMCHLIRGRSESSVFIAVEGSGPNRVQDALERLFASPLISGVASLSTAEALSIQVLSGPSLTMVEVNRLMEGIQAEARGTPVIMGASVSEPLEKRLRVGVLLALPKPAASGTEQTDLTEPSMLGARGAHAAEPLNYDRLSGSRPASRFVAPPPPSTLEKIDKIRGKKGSSRLRQGQLPLEIVSKGRFEKSEPTIHQGEDLDIPTYIRRRVALN